MSDPRARHRVEGLSAERGVGEGRARLRHGRLPGAVRRGRRPTTKATGPRLAREFVQLEEAVHQGARREPTRRSSSGSRTARSTSSYNCLDRNVEAGLGDKIAIIFEADDGKVTRVTYKRAAGARSASSPTPEVAGHQEGRPRRHLHVDERSRAWSRCRPARASAPSTRWSSAASRRSRVRDRIAGRRRRGGDHRRRAAARRQAAAAEGHRRRSASRWAAARRIKNVIVYKRTGGNDRLEAGARPLAARRDRRPARPPASPSGSAPSTRCSCSTPRAPPASPRACSTAPAATCCMRR